jgi:hypothetical protein
MSEGEVFTTIPSLTMPAELNLGVVEKKLIIKIS